MKLSRTNNYVYKQFCKKANPIQRKQMLDKLKEQLDNLQLLYNMMVEFDGESK